MARNTIPSRVIERLIELVRANPCLYDVTDADYHDNFRKNNIWNSIARELRGEWDLDPKRCKAKWKQLRDRYNEEKKKIKEFKSGDAAKKVRPWPFYGQMQFLEPYTAPARYCLHIFVLINPGRNHSVAAAVLAANERNCKFANSCVRRQYESAPYLPVPLMHNFP